MVIQNLTRFAKAKQDFISMYADNAEVAYKKDDMFVVYAKLTADLKMSEVHKAILKVNNQSPYKFKRVPLTDRQDDRDPAPNQIYLVRSLFNNECIICSENSFNDFFEVI